MTYTPSSDTAAALSTMLISILPKDFHDRLQQDESYDKVLYSSPEHYFCDALAHTDVDDCGLGDLYSMETFNEATLDMLDDFSNKMKPQQHLDTPDLLHAYRERFDPTANHTIDMI